jgi:L-alanine-DL-glutamate epimerase-like enolase superfamily enzyme
MLDVGWCGGATSAQEIAALAESYGVVAARLQRTGGG